jgi:hypothetical protein
VVIDHLPGILTAEAAAGVCHVVDAFSRGHVVGLSELGLILSDAPAIGQPLGCDLDNCIGSAAAAGLSCCLVEILSDQARNGNPERFDPFRCIQYTEDWSSMG